MSFPKGWKARQTAAIARRQEKREEYASKAPQREQVSRLKTLDAARNAVGRAEDALAEADRALPVRENELVAYRKKEGFRASPVTVLHLETSIRICRDTIDERRATLETVRSALAEAQVGFEEALVAATLEATVGESVQANKKGAK